jgi:hypothetical protein
MTTHAVFTFWPTAPVPGQLIKISIPRSRRVNDTIVLAKPIDENPREQYAIVMEHTERGLMKVLCIHQCDGETEEAIKKEIETQPKKGAAVPTSVSQNIRPCAKFNGGRHLTSLSSWEMETAGFIDRHWRDLRYQVTEYV